MRWRASHCSMFFCTIWFATGRCSRRRYHVPTRCNLCPPQGSVVYGTRCTIDTIDTLLEPAPTRPNWSLSAWRASSSTLMRHRACEQPAQYLPCHIRNGNKGGLVLGPTNSLLYPRGAVAGRHYDAAQAARPVQGQLLAGRGDSASTGLRQQGDSQATSSCPLRAHRHHPQGRSAQGSRWHTATARRRCAGDSACTPLASVGGATQSSQQ